MLKLKGDNHQNEIFLDPNMKVFVGWSNVRGHWCESESRFPAGGVFKESWQSWLTNSSPVVCYSQADLSNLTLKSSTQKTCYFRLLLCVLNWCVRFFGNLVQRHLAYEMRDFMFVSVRVNMHHLQFKMILILSYTGGLVETPVHPLMIKARPLS